MEFDKLKYLIKALAKSISASVRLYGNNKQLYTYSVYPLNPDPVFIYENELLLSKHLAGVFTTDLFQFFGYATLDCGYRVIIGPSSILVKDVNKLEKLMFLLNVKEEDKEEYANKLESAPSISAERMAWILSFFASTVNTEPLFIENVSIQTAAKDYEQEILRKSIQKTLSIQDETDPAKLVLESYKTERMMSFYIKNGQPNALLEMMNAMPRIKAGTMSRDTLRQAKNMGICSAAIASRSSIEGGLSVQLAFQLSDLYINKIEILRSSTEIFQLMNKMLLEFAKRTKLANSNSTSSSKLFLKCADYVSANLYRSIRVTEISDTLGMSRSHLCTQFHQQTGITLSQYILNEKIMEAKRLLHFTDKSLSEIAMHLAFSSQSHFQTVFKKISGMPPNQYRRSQSDWR